MHYLIGGSGIPNYGDELMARGWLRYLAQQYPEDRVIIDTAIPSVSTLLLQPDNWKASHVSVVKELSLLNKRGDFWDNFERGLNFFTKNEFANYPRLGLAQRYLESAGSFHMFGGGYISTKWVQTGFLLGFAGAIQQAYGIRLFGTGLGLTPISSPPEQLRQSFQTVLEGFTAIELRDKTSEGFIRDHGGTNIVEGGLDDCFLEPPPPLGDHPATLHISAFMKDRELAPLLRRLDRRRDRLSTRFERIRFWMCAPHRDQETLNEIRELFPQIEVLPIERLLANPEFSARDVMITSRFHPHMIAARAGIRGYYHQISGDYYAAKHQSVIELGSRFRPFSDFEAHNFDIEPCTEMAQADPERVERKQKIAALIYATPN